MLVFHGLVILAAPFESRYPVAPAMAVLTCFLVIFFSSARLAIQGWGRQAKLPAPSSCLGKVLAEPRLLFFLAFASLTGLVFHVWAKYYLTELFPVACLSSIRFAWLAVDRAVLPAHIRVASMLGHLLTAFAYFGVLATSFNAVYGRARFPRHKDLFLVVFFTLVGVVYAGFIGSKNAMLGFLIMGLAGVVLGAASSPRKQILAPLSILAIPLLSALVFSSIIFSDRLFCSTPESLARNAQGAVSDKQIVRYHIGGFYKEFALVAREQKSLDTQSPDIRELLFVDICSVCVPTMVYLNHGLFNMGRMMSSDQRGEQVLLKFFVQLPSRLGLISSSPASEVEKRVYGPGGMPFAGAAYHDYGIPGIVTTAALMGLLFGFSLRLLQTPGRGALVGLWLFGALFYVLMLSNIFVGTNVLPFPFIAFGIGGGLAAYVLIERLRKTNVQ
jgi:hypothetical protein